MEGCHTPRVSPARDLQDNNTGHHDQAYDGPDWHEDGVSEISHPGAFAESADPGRSFSVEEAPDILDDMDDSGLLRSFDMVFRIHQRSEEIRKQLDKIDGILLTSRSTGELAERLIEVLRTEMDLSAACLVFKQDHPIASLLRRAQSDCVTVVPDGLFEDERFAQSDPFVLDYPSDPLGISLFGESWNKACSAAVANLCTDTEEMGVLCLGSSDPYRYRSDMNTELVASLAEKIAFGLRNAWDHETSVFRAIFDRVDRVHSEAFLHEYLLKEFHRAWRGESTFALMSLAWKPLCGAEPTSLKEVSEVTAQNIRSADLLARCGSNDFWVLLPATALQGARIVAERLISVVDAHFHGAVVLHIGIAGFSRDTAVAGMLINQARTALKQAALSETHQIEVQTVQTIAE